MLTIRYSDLDFKTILPCVLCKSNCSLPLLLGESMRKRNKTKEQERLQGRRLPTVLPVMSRARVKWNQDVKE